MGLALVWLLPLSRRSAGSAPGVPLVNELAAEFPPELPPGVFAHVGDGVRLGVGFGLGAGEAVPAGASWKVLWMLCVIEECTTTRPACISPTISPRSCTRWRTCEMWGDVGRWGEMWGERHGEI